MHDVHFLRATKTTKNYKLQTCEAGKGKAIWKERLANETSYRGYPSNELWHMMIYQSSVWWYDSANIGIAQSNLISI